MSDIRLTTSQVTTTGLVDFLHYSSFFSTLFLTSHPPELPGSTRTDQTTVSEVAGVLSLVHLNSGSDSACAIVSRVLAT